MYNQVKPNLSMGNMYRKIQLILISKILPNVIYPQINSLDRFHVLEIAISIEDVVHWENIFD